MPLREQVLSTLLALSAELLAHRHPVLTPVEAVSLHLLTHGGAILPVYVLPAHRLPLLRAICPHLLPILRLRAVRADLLAILRVSAVGALLLAGGRTLLMLRTSLPGFVARRRSGLCALMALLHPLRVRATLDRAGPARLLALCARRRHALGTLLALRPWRGLALLSRRGESAAAVTSATASICGSRVASTMATAIAVMRPRIRRDCDRQRGNACGEKQPGHKLSPFERLKRPVRGTVPTLKRMELAP